MKKGALAAVVGVVLAGAAGWLASARLGPVERQWGQPLGLEATPLNPHGFPQIPACTKIPLNDPVAEARANVAKGDLRPFTVYGFTPGRVPGVFCPSGDYRLESRGGTFVSDMPDACGAHSFSNAASEKMEIYNRAVAADTRFQGITGCRPSTYCEEQYRKGVTYADRRDPRCPGEPGVLVNVARAGARAALVEALGDFADRSPKARDAMTAAFLAALGNAKWDNAEALLSAGADINGRAFDQYPDKRQWLGSPLEALFNQNQDREAKISRARWLFARGLDFSNPGAHQSLTWAASSNDIAAVNFLLANGASPNGPMSAEDQDRLARGNIQSAGGGHGYGQTPLYTALGQATLRWTRRTPAEAAHADGEHRKGRMNAVTLYRAGGRFIVGMLYNDFRRESDIKVASIVLAAAHREGRLQDVITRVLYPNGNNRPFDPGSTDEERALIDYLREVEGCPAIRPMPQSDYVKLCANGDV